jgi:hypothetical protein
MEADKERCAPKDMREIVKNCEDTRLLSMFNIIENQLKLEPGFKEPIIIVASSNRTKNAGIQYTSDGYIFHYNPNTNYATHDDVIFHELLHICLNIEGWPIFIFDDNEIRELEVNYGEKIHYIINVLSTLWPHTKIWEMEKEFGFSSISKIVWDNEIVGTRLSQLSILWKSVWEQCWKVHQGKKAPSPVLELVQSLLAPTSDEVHLLLQESLKKHLPEQARQQVESICRVFAVPEQPFPQSIPDALAEVGNRVEFPQLRLELDHLSNGTIDPHFFDRRIRPLFS